MAHIVVSQLAQAPLGNVALPFQSYDQLFINGPGFSGFPNASIAVNSSVCGPSGSTLDRKYTGQGKGLFPDIEWEEPSSLDELIQYLLVVEDPDAPTPEPVVHGLYYSIPRRQHGISNKDLLPEGNAQYDNLLVGGFLYGLNHRNTIYLPPNPPAGDGPHKYFYQVVGLSKELDLSSLSAMPSKKELAEAVAGTVTGWGVWIGVYEHK